MGNVDSGCGWVTITRNADSIREALVNILRMPPPEALDEVKRNARKKAEAEFSADTYGEEGQRRLRQRGVPFVHTASACTHVGKTLPFCFFPCPKCIWNVKVKTP